jgi:serine/threonine protein kinase
MVPAAKESKVSRKIVRDSSGHARIADINQVTQVASVSVTVEQALGSRYVLEERISSGGMGEIWRGRDLVADRPVAIKVLHERLASDPAELTRFVRERTVLTGLDHPNLVPVRDMIVEGSRLALIMDLVAGPDLHHYLRAHGPLAPALAATLISQTCEALAVVHAAGIVHRDLKPSNILLDTSQSPPIARLTDFGIARTDDALPLTAGHIIIGTPQYCAPEVVNGERGGPAVDVYAAGTTLYELLVGTPPFAGGPATTVFWRHLDAEPLRSPGIPASLWPVIEACLAKDPEQRPTAAAAARSLRDCLPAVRDALPAAPLAPDALRFKPSSKTVDEKDKPRAPADPPAAKAVEPAAPIYSEAVETAHTEAVNPAAPTSREPRGRPAVTGAAVQPDPARRRRLPTMRPALTLSLMAVAGLATAGWLVFQGSHATSTQLAGSSASSAAAGKQPTPAGAFAGLGGLDTAAPSLSAKPSRSRARPSVSPAHRSSSAPPGTAVRATSATPTGSATHQASVPPVTASHAPPAPSPKPSNVLLYTFEDGTADGWKPGSDMSTALAASKITDGPGHAYDGTYCLDVSPVGLAPATAQRSVSVSFTSPLNLSRAQSFFVTLDGYGSVPNATGYTATITLTGGGQQLVTSVLVKTNSWSRLVLPVSTWAQRGQITNIAVSYNADGTDFEWAPHFQLDDVGYTT